jgi:hypothetical protein
MVLTDSTSSPPAIPIPIAAARGIRPLRLISPMYKGLKDGIYSARFPNMYDATAGSIFDRNSGLLF